MGDRLLSLPNKNKLPCTIKIGGCFTSGLQTRMRYAITVERGSSWANVSPEWALKIKGESICADCLRILQIEMDAQNPPGPLSTAAPKLPPR